MNQSFLLALYSFPCSGLFLSFSGLFVQSVRWSSIGIYLLSVLFLIFFCPFIHYFWNLPLFIHLLSCYSNDSKVNNLSTPYFPITTSYISGYTIASVFLKNFKYSSAVQPGAAARTGRFFLPQNRRYATADIQPTGHYITSARQSVSVRQGVFGRRVRLILVLRREVRRRRGSWRRWLGFGAWRRTGRRWRRAGR